MEVLNFELLRIIIALLATAAAAYQDYKTSFIDEKIIYIMLAVGVLLNLVDFAISGSMLIAFSLIVSIIMLLFGYLFYKKGQLGMGDVLLFVAIQQILPLAPAALLIVPKASNVFSMIEYLPETAWLLRGYLSVVQHAMFFITIFLISSFLATIGSALQYARILFSSKKGLRPNKLYGALSALLLVAGTILLYFIFGISAITVLFFLLILSTAFFLTFRDQILDEVVIQKIPISRIEDEDILSIEKMPSELVKKYKLQKVLTAAEVKKLKQIEKNEGLKLFPVNKILPRFGPYILAALIVGLLLGDITDIIFLLS